MVQVPRLISRSVSSMLGSSQPWASFSSLMFFTNCSPQPNFFAKAYMMVWSGLDSNSGSMTFSRHCSERFDAVAEPWVSNWVQAGSR